MKFLFILLSVVSYSAQSLVTFHSGDVATADDFNSNFQEVKGASSSNAAAISSLQSSSLTKTDAGRVTASVNGESRDIYTVVPGYNMVYVGQNQIPINADGELPWEGQSYYESPDCTGQPYIIVGYIDHEKPIGEEFENPKLTSKITFHKINGEAHYDTGSPVVKLHYKSAKNSSGCRANSNTSAAVPAYPNNSEITGVSFPLIITGLGTRFSITEEVGTPPEGAATGTHFEVYANGVNIGYARYLPTGAESYISVYLYDNQDDLIYLNKDGSYSGYDNGSSAELYYQSNDCSGQPYSKVLSSAATKWWNENKLSISVVKNNGNFYNLSDEIYKFPNGSQSYKYSSSDSCRVVLTSQAGYKKAISTASPAIPIFEPPIVIEGYIEPTIYNELPDAD